MKAFCILFYLVACLAIVGSAKALDATLVEDTYVQTSTPDVNYNGSEFEIYIRNYSTVGRLGLVQFTLPPLPANTTADEISRVKLAGAVAWTHSSTTSDRDISLEMVGLSVNPDLATVTYDDLYDPTGNGMVMGYRTSPNFTYGNLATSLDRVILNTADMPVGAGLVFPDQGGNLLSYVQSNVSGTQSETVTFAIGPGNTTSGNADFRFYSMENTAGANPMSLTLNTATDSYQATLIEDCYVQTSTPDDNYDGSELEVYIRNYNTIGRAGLVQFALPQLPSGVTPADITSVELAGVSAFQHSTAREMSLEVLGLSVNPDLTTVTYNDLFDEEGNDVIADYSPAVDGNFIYGSQATILENMTFNTADTPVDSILEFTDVDGNLVEYIKANISETEATTVTITVGPGDTASNDCDFRFYALENTAGADPASLTIIIGDPLPGDANLDGIVDNVDAATLAQNWQSIDADWSTGDFNGDGVVDDIDATLLASNWTTGASASVPEPSAITLLLIIAGLLSAWKQRR